MTESDAERFWAKVERRDDGCWIWSACRNSDGYGRFMLNGKNQRAHRVSYQSLRGSIPSDRVLDHLCRNRACVNPEHLEPVTPGENSRRGIVGDSARRRNSGITQCKRGHTFDARNTHYNKRTGSRTCRACGALRKRKYNQQRREAEQ